MGQRLTRVAILCAREWRDPVERPSKTQPVPLDKCIAEVALAVAFLIHHINPLMSLT